MLVRKLFTQLLVHREIRDVDPEPMPTNHQRGNRSRVASSAAGSSEP